MGYYLYMGLLIVTLILWTVLAVQDSGPDDGNGRDT